jgi:uncharacterized membrane protein YgaE (UPF0421/DUF939 family)
MSIELISTVASGVAVASLVNLVLPLVKVLYEKYINHRANRIIHIRIEDENGVEKQVEIRTSVRARIDEEEIKRLIKLLEENADASQKIS